MEPSQASGKEGMLCEPSSRWLALVASQVNSKVKRPKLWNLAQNNMIEPRKLSGGTEIWARQTSMGEHKWVRSAESLSGHVWQASLFCRHDTYLDRILKGKILSASYFKVCSYKLLKVSICQTIRFRNFNF